MHLNKEVPSKRSRTSQHRERPSKRLLNLLPKSSGSNIFELNLSMVPLITQLSRTGHRLGILSNTSASHWEYCRRHFAILRDCFEKKILSYEVGTMKPQEAIYQAAIDATGVPAAKIFYTDDLEPNIQGGVECGMDAVLYTDAPNLINAMRQRNLQI